MTSPVLSICIPAYNNPTYLYDALRSVCEQNLEKNDFVVIISDDASPNSLDEVISEFRSLLNIAYHRSHSNLGHIRNFENVFALSETRLVSFLPHDDVLAPGHLGRALNIMKDHPDVVLLAGQVIHQRFPCAPESRIHGFSFRADPTTWALKPQLWESTEWMASVLVGTPFNMIGSIYQTNAFKKCTEWKNFPLWHDRVWCAELALHGKVLSLPWVCGYYRVTEEQMSVRLTKSNGNEFVNVSEWLIELCEVNEIPVIAFWIDFICSTIPSLRSFYLEKLFHALPTDRYNKLRRECEKLLNTQIRRNGRLAKLGLPIAVEKRLRALLNQ